MDFSILDLTLRDPSLVWTWIRDLGLGLGTWTWDLDLGLGTWDLDLGLGLGLVK